MHGSDDVGVLQWSCSLDLSEAGPMSPEQVAHVMGVTRDQLRQIEAEAIVNARRAGIEWGELDFADDADEHAVLEP